MIKAVIFDMDGTMVDSEVLHSKAYEQVLKNHGFEPEYNELGIVFTPGIKGWPGLVGNYDIKEDYALLTQEKRRIFSELISSIQPMPGFLRLLKFLKEKKYKLGIATSSHPDTATRVLKALQIENIFDVVCGTDDTQKAKPFPDIYLRAAKNLQVDPSECLVFEDSETGVTSAVTAGMKVVAVPSPYTKHQNFDAAYLILPSLNKVTLSLIQSL